jgi:uncharacterized RDD family membrane protein YckC
MEQESAAESNRDACPEAAPVWRDEVNARVAGYRNRRGRRIEGAFSMRFPFPPMEPLSDSSPLQAAAAATESNSVAEESVSEGTHHTTSLPASGSPDEVDERCDPPAQPVQLINDVYDAPAAEESAAQALPAPRPKRKVLAFPKPLVVDPELYYDDPVVSEQPRILDVPQELPSLYTTPLLDGLQFPAREQPATTAPADRDELPLQAVRIAQRLYAGLIDCAAVLVAAGIFAAACYKLLPKLTLSKPLLLSAAAVLVLIWAVYQYLFVVYGGRTLGMQVVAIRLSRFDGKPLRFRQRRRRVLALYFSVASLMMGLLWALVDVDALCWHDRISRTYLIRKSNQ